MDARSNVVLHEPDYAATGGRPSIGIGDIVDVLRRGWRLPAIGLTVGLAIGVGLLVVVKAPYKSTARILIDRSMNRYLQNSKIIDQPTLEDTEIGGQIYVMSSDSVIVPVVKAMKLTQDSEFARGDGAAAERAAVESVLKRLTVNREDVANVITVTFESQNAVKAADIANAIAESYIDVSVQQKLKSTRTVSRWLQERLAELKPQVAEAERALQAYRDANNLSNTGTGSQKAERLANLKVQWDNARIALAEAKDRYDRIQHSPEVVTSAMAAEALVNTSRAGIVLSNNDLIRVRGQYRELTAKAAEIEARVGVGSQHEALAKIRRQVDFLRNAMRGEEERLIAAYANEYELAKVKEAEVAATVAQVSGDGDTNGQLRELESAVETLRNLQSGFLQKYKEINSAQAETLPAQNAHIITRAIPQLSRSSKKALGLFGGSLVFCLFLGVGAAVGREWLVDVLRTPRAVEQVTGIRCVVLPRIESRSVTEHVLVAPYSRFTESLREVNAMIDEAANGDEGKVIGVLSAVPKEGKTVVAANLAALLTDSTGARTLVIDGDFHLRTLSAALAPGARAGLIEALEDPARLSQLVTRLPRSGLDVLPCVLPSRIPNAAELLGSARMERLLATARQSYDYIIVEIAPVMSVVDVRMAERFIDGFVFVVEWGQTKRTLVVDALSCAARARERVMAVVLNKVDAAALRTIEAQKGARSGDYYQD